MLDVDESPVGIPEIEVETGELRADSAVRGPAGQALSRIQEVAVLVPVGGEPDVVVRATAAIFDDVDVAFVVNREVVGVEIGRASCRERVFRVV